MKTVMLMAIAMVTVASIAVMTIKCRLIRKTMALSKFSPFAPISTSLLTRQPSRKLPRFCNRPKFRSSVTTYPNKNASERKELRPDAFIMYQEH